MFADAGLTILRTKAADSPEIWLRLDGGPHGFLAIAAHAHADALSVEVRYGGIDILADPGTYCYHGEPEWRKYFQSTIGHNTVEVDDQWQSARGGPFLWLKHARGRESAFTDNGTAVSWKAEHDGYAPTTHTRAVLLDRAARSIEIIDEIKGGSHGVRLAFHLGPDVHAELEGSDSILSWTPKSARGTARMSLPGELRWSLHRGETSPILGWYSAALGTRVPAYTLLGTGHITDSVQLVTRLLFVANDEPSGHTRSSEATSWGASPG